MTSPRLVLAVIVSLVLIALGLMVFGFLLAIRHAVDTAVIVSIFGAVGGPVTGLCALLSNNGPMLPHGSVRAVDLSATRTETRGGEGDGR
jgi:hypothetical protein